MGRGVAHTPLTTCCGGLIASQPFGKRRFTRMSRRTRNGRTAMLGAWQPASHPRCGFGMRLVACAGSADGDREEGLRGG